MAGSNIVAQTVAYGSLVLLAHWLTPTNFGTVAVGTAIAGIGVLFVDRGTWGTVIVEPNLTRSELMRAFRRCMATAIVLAAVMAGASELVVNRFATGGHPGAVAAIALCLPLHAIAVVPTALLQRAMQFRRLAGVTGLANIASALAAVALAMSGAGVWALVARQLTLFGLVALLSTVLCLSLLRSYPAQASDSAPTRSRMRSEWSFFLFSVTNAINGSLDKFVIGLFGGAAVIGLYSIGNTIAMAPWTQFSSQAGQVLFATAAAHRDGLSQRTVQSARLMALLMLPMLPLGILLAPAVLPVAFGPEWSPIVPVFQLLLIVGIGNAIVNCIAETLTGIGHMPFRVWIMVAQLVATFVALLLLVPLDGIRGAALAQLLVFVPYAAVYFFGGARRVGTSAAAMWRGIRPAVTISALQAMLSAAAAFMLMEAGATDAVAAGVAAVVGLASVAPLLVRQLARMWSS
jgi:O-antigen/teichoic acid export membrane protein